MNQSNKLLSDITAFRTYAKYLSNLGRRESLAETINRDMSMHLDRYPQLSKDIIKAFQQVHDFKIMPSMRSLQFAGDAILKNNARQYNCSFTAIDTTRKFSEALFLLLSGVGVGFSVQKHHVNQLPKIGTPREEGVFKVHDSIIGWAQALDMLINAYFNNGIRPVFDFSYIRQKGSYLVTTGAKAPGPEPLKYMLDFVESILKKSQGRKLSPIEVHDLICIVSDCVLAGGVRRSALISLFDRTDEEMLNCKSGEWWIRHPYRARANNSAVLPLNETTKEEFDAIYDICRKSKCGEPGFSWTNDSVDMGVNPCQPGFAKVTLASGAQKTFDDLKVGDVLLSINRKETVVLKKWSNGIKPVFAYKVKDNGVFIGTEGHRVPAIQLDKVEIVKVPIDEAFKKQYLVCGENTAENIISKVYLGDYEVFDITVSDDTHTYLTNGVYASNCHEIALKNNQFCNLSTINQTGINSEKDFLSRVYSATLIGTVQASYTDFPYLTSEWKSTTEEEALLGVSFTGISDSSGLVTSDLLQRGASLALEVNEKYAKKLGINLAARVCTVKPEGSSSCVLGSSSGIHSRHAPYYVRRIRMNKDDSLAHYLKQVMPDLVEDDKFSSTGVVVSIPQESPTGCITRNNETAIDLFKRIMKYNKYWVANGHRSGENKHNVSATISVKEHEWDELRELMWKNRRNYSGISLLPYDGGSYVQAPFEEIDKAKFEELSKLVKDVNLTEVKEETDNTSRVETIACAGGLCEFTGN